MQVKSACLEQAEAITFQPGIGRDCAQPIDMQDKLLASFLLVIEARLDPLEPVSLSEAWGRVSHTAVRDEVFEPLHAVPLILRQVIPPIVDSPIVLVLVICCYAVLAFRNDEVGRGGRDVVRVLLVVAGVVRVIGVWWVYPLL